MATVRISATNERPPYKKGLPKSKDKILPPVRANPTLEIRFRRKLLGLIEEMHRSVAYWIVAQYRETPPAFAEDASPANSLQREMDALKVRWFRKFDEDAEKLAEYYADAIQDRSDAALKGILKKSGFSVKFRMTKAQRDIKQATVHENVSLIKSIPAKYLGDVEGMVMRSVQTGRDLGSLSKSLQKSYNVTKRRAALIARDQNNKATSAMNRARQSELGIKQAIWVHSHAGKTPRPSHLKAGRDKVKYDIDKGWYDPDEGEYILPGQLINCRCTSKSIIPGFI